MSTLQGLLVGCAESPDESTPHLILADWLEDHGQSARAELVRIQCRLADWVPDWQERHDLIQHQNALIEQHRESWLGSVLAASPHIEFVRGLARLWVTGRTFSTKALGAALQQHHDTALIEEIRLVRCASLKSLSMKPWLARVPALSLAHLRLDSETIAWILQSTEAAHLVRLDLSGNLLGHAPLPEGRLWQQITHLTIRNAELTSETVRDLLPRLSGQLRDLDLAGNPIEPDLLDNLGQPPTPRRPRNSLGMEFIQVPAGTYRRGSPLDEPGRMEDERPHTVRLTRPFWLGRFAVTQGQYDQLFTDNNSAFSGPFRPVERVTWTRAVEFCQTLSNLPAEREAGRSYRLPTEAEREHACRAGTFTAFYVGPRHSMDLMNCQQRFTTNQSPRILLDRTADVGSYPPNAFGLFDMHGNVWEWCQDWYAASYPAADDGTEVCDPTGPETGSERVARGGCWEAIGSYCRAAKRLGDPPHTASNHIGFRVVLELNRQEPGLPQAR